MATWAVEHRPQLFSEIAGQDHIAPVLAGMVAKSLAGGLVLGVGEPVARLDFPDRRSKARRRTSPAQ